MKERMGLQRGSLALTLLLVLQLAASSQGHPCQAPERKCDFVCDCSDCSDEEDCGYKAADFVCDFERAGMCGWNRQPSDPAYTWEKRQRGDTLPDSGPSSDFTLGTASGWFMGVTAVKSDSPRTAVLTSPEMKQSSPTCRLRLRYFLWGSALGPTPLWASVWRKDSKEAVVWRSESTSVRGWREATIFLGRISTAFQIRLNSRRSMGNAGDVAVDHLEFLDCALPLPPPGEGCAAGLFECKREGCVAQRQLCDGTDDCGDRTDEEPCEGYWGCDFEKDLCEWNLASLSNLKWVRTSQEKISTTDPSRGPGRDHSTNSASGHFLYVTVPDGGLKMDWASFQSPLLDPTNSTHPCKMVMYTHQFGPRSGGLTVLVADRNIYPVWERGGALGDLWVKAEVEIVTNSTFYIVLMAAVRDFAYGGIAIDSITLSPECRISSGNHSSANFPKPPKDPCTSPDKMCDFHPDCEGAEDEAKCGDFSYAAGSSGWTDASIGSQGWVLNKGSTTKEDYIYVTQAPGQQLTEAQTRTPLLGPSGPVCTLSFSFALTGNPQHIGELSVAVIDNIMGRHPKLWEFSGKTGKDEGAWRKAEVHIGNRKHRFQLEFQARAKKLCRCAKIKVKDVRFINCYTGYFPFSPSGMSCNFEDGLCAWYQDKNDNFDWSVVSGMDHTIHVGKSLVVDLLEPSLRGVSGNLLSFPQQPISTEHCLAFFYKIYGPETGVLNVKVIANNGFENVLWTRSGAHGNVWHEAMCPVAHQPTKFQLVFETVRSGFDGRVAIDDVSFLARPCTMPRICSFESQRCGYSSSGTNRWLHRNGHSATTGPKTDHTLETEMGYYMMVESDKHVLPVGSKTVLSSPIQQGAPQARCLHFWYHMGGENPGSLTVYVKPRAGERVNIFSDSLNQGNVWRHGSGNISGVLADWQLEFEVEGAGGKGTHVAVDDIAIFEHLCQSQGSKCNFEKGMCSWSNSHDPKVDKLDWELTSPEAETLYATPPYDHTLGTEKGHFLFLPSSSRTPVSANAQLISPHLPPTKGTCFKFWVYRPDSADNQLKVWMIIGDHLEQLLVVNERATWKRYDINITAIRDYQVALEGIKGTAGVLALDDLEFTIGINCNGKVTDPVKSDSDNYSGGVGASVIVLLLLLGTLMFLLYYYLRSREKSNPVSSHPSNPSANAGFGNDTYEPQDHVVVPPAQGHPVAAGFNDVAIPDSHEVREREVA
ncbi:apical endosomal glycoprotein [Lampris incognitus]|uniref:apical endosomal glycoprotein n=1 Tax=Lampris incognitus TaxID=2546036 RepID=UPI0024B4F600|nr:apical endosomal glycoprotein [Lampris incognitus]